MLVSIVQIISTAAYITIFYFHTNRYETYIFIVIRVGAHVTTIKKCCIKDVFLESILLILRVDM